MKNLLKNFSYFIQDYWLNANNPLVWVILVVLVSLGFGVVQINVLITEWSKGFYDILFSASQGRVIYGLISEYLMYVGIFILTSVARAWLRKLLIIK